MRNVCLQNNAIWLVYSISEFIFAKTALITPSIQKDNIYSAAKLWNTEIPIQLKQSMSLKVFKKSYKNSLPDLKHLMMCIFFLYYWIIYSSLKKTFTAYTVYLHFAAFWLVKWIEMSVTTFLELRASSLASSVSTRHLQHLSNVY